MATHRPPPETDGRPLTEQLQLPPGPADLGRFDPHATTGFPGRAGRKGKKDAPEVVAALSPELSDLQERLFAAGRADPKTAPNVLVVLQGMDTSGKGGVIRHTFGLVDPQGLQLTSFKAPTRAERRHPYLWRIEKALPRPGLIGIFDRSHYEDVLVVRVEELVPEVVWRARYDEINAWEAGLAAAGTTVIKCFLHISAEKQRERLAERLADETKYWKYNPGDLAARARWDDYVLAYQAALERCHTPAAPWYVIPADRKWYRNWAIAQLLREKLRSLGLGWPPADFDVAVEQARVAES